MVCTTNRINVTSTGSSVCPRSLAKTSRAGIKSIAAQSWRIPVVDLEPDARRAGSVKCYHAQTVPAIWTEVNRIRRARCQVVQNYVLRWIAVLIGLSFRCIQINWTNRQFMAVG